LPFDAIGRTDAAQRAAATLTSQASHISVRTLIGSARAAFIASIWRQGAVTFAVVVPDDRTCDDVAHDLRTLIGADAVAAVRAEVRHSAIGGTTALQHDQVDALTRLKQGTARIMVVSAPAFTLRIPSRDDIGTSTMRLTKGETIRFEDLVTTLAVHGFERQDFVSSPGEMAVRGGIVDIFPGGWDNPLRLEFWGDTIESIREFEPLSQRSIRELETASFLGRVYHDDDPTLEASIADHIPADAVVVVIDPEAVAAEMHQRDAEWASDRFSAWRRLTINPLGQVDAEVRILPQPAFGASVEQLLRAASTLRTRDLQVYVGADGHANAKRVRDLCENMVEQIEHDDIDLALTLQQTLEHMRWMSAAVSEGFTWDDAGVAAWTEHQVFGRQRAQARTKRSEGGISIRELRQLHKGDYVVHEDKGIGRFDGLETITIGGSAQECVRVLYHGDDVLYVHLNYVHKLSKYAAEEGAVPSLSKLGSAEWERRKAKAKRRIKDIARDLIKLYAQRKSQPGFSYPMDTVWQKEFEAAFQYEDTPDQARATAEVKVDMESPTPMDRLVCGDVGFGKTEVAIRAAFKAAQAGRQVAVLVPTTILAQQHYVTFRDRLSRYPVRVEVLSRFRSRAEQKEVIDDLQAGRVDIVIGTHRLLSKDVGFRNLGLLIIDEEHRFGVAAKEKLRQLRANVDTLTLTATPIPRTLNFSLMGARDLSVIETPPRNRLPVKTEILQWHDDVLREAILRELDRGGQVFIVTDRIHDMDKLMMKFLMLVPSLKVGLAHGQMESEKLEDVMEGFLERKFDVLIATKIIESGLDIPNANTMIIMHADNFGLAELYQLRGRVGRSNIQAWCYLVIPPPHTLSRVALRRLQALEEHTDLGSGFQLAMRDLEIRGAGNLLGGEQSGFIMDMGFELYQKILDEAVSELRHDEFAELFGAAKDDTKRFVNEDIAIELDVDALLPKVYIPTDTERYEAYKRLYNAHDDAEIDAAFADLRDRYGTMPPEAEELLFAVRMRIAAMPTGFVRVNVRGTRLLLELPPDTNTVWYEHAFQRILPIVTTMRNTRFVQQPKRLLVQVDMDRRDDAIGVLRSFADAIVTIPTEADA
jgi:transcription-repair coupling factor (superfamily II helicase)